VTTFNTGSTVGGNIVPVTSFQYQDVGIKIEVEPRVHHNREITLKLTVEVSQVTGSVPVENGSPPSDHRHAHDLVEHPAEGRRDEPARRTLSPRRKRTDTQIPFLSDLPIIGRLVTNVAKDDQTTDIVLTMTPHIIRIPDITEEDVSPVYVGTDQKHLFPGRAAR
jgi:general secretion pathway protein D